MIVISGQPSRNSSNFKRDTEIDIYDEGDVSSIAFLVDGKHVVSGSEGGKIRRWRVADGVEVGTPMKAGSAVRSIAVSRDGKWIVSGTESGKVQVWNAENGEKASEFKPPLQVLTSNSVQEVDVSPDSTQIASGSRSGAVFVWSLSTRKRLFGPWRPGSSTDVLAVKFSPDGRLIATATERAWSSLCVRVNNSQDGHLLVEVRIKVKIPNFSEQPLAWSSNSKQLFALSHDCKIYCLDATTGGTLSRWRVHGNGCIAKCITLTNNGAFIAASVGSSVSFWDTTTHKRIGPVIEHGTAPIHQINCMAISANYDIAIGGGSRITLRTIRDILLSSYFPNGNQGIRVGVKSKRPSSADRNILDGNKQFGNQPVRYEGGARKNEHTNKRSPDLGIRQLCKRHALPSRSAAIIDDAIRVVLQTSPLVLIDVESGHLCNGSKRVRIYKSEPEFEKLLSSITERSGRGGVQRAVKKYFEYVTLSHVWEGEEPLLQDVDHAGSVWDLDRSFPLNQKLRNFCKMVRADGYRWAWSDTCCIDKTISTVLSQSLKMMYKWYEESAATFVFLVDVTSPSAPGALFGSNWMTRAWTSQELLAPKVIRFYTRKWKPYLGDTRPNHKESPEIMRELADAIGVARRTIIAFNPDNLDVREKLRLASTRNATREEDVAYSLIGIFKSDIQPAYGEGYAALGHLLEEIVARSGDVILLAWTGRSSQYHSCLPATLAVYSRPPGTLSATNSTAMVAYMEELRRSLPRTYAIWIYDRITALPPARFANRRLHLPCIIFAVRRFVQDFGNGSEINYYAQVSGIGVVEFQTSDRLSPREPRRLILVHPWIRELLDPFDPSTWGSTTYGDGDNNGYTRALRLLARLYQPFYPLLLQQQPNGEYKRVAVDHEIVVQGLDLHVDLAKHARIDVVEIL